MTGSPGRDNGAPTPPERDAARQVPPLSPPHDALLLPTVHALVDPYVAAARHGYGHIPAVRSDEFLTAPPTVQLAALLVLAEAWLVGDPHLVARAVLAQTSHDVHGGHGETWRRAGLQHQRNLALVAQRRTDRDDAHQRAQPTRRDPAA